MILTPFSVRQGLRNGDPKYNVKAGNLPNFLWEKEVVEDPANLWAGFGYGPLLVLVSLPLQSADHHLISCISGPAVLAVGTQVRYAHPWCAYRLTQTKSACIPYTDYHERVYCLCRCLGTSHAHIYPSLSSHSVASQVHFALSSQEQFSATGYGNKFNYEKFYQRIVSAIEEHMPENRRRELLAWWNGCVPTDLFMLMEMLTPG